MEDEKEKISEETNKGEKEKKKINILKIFKIMKKYLIIILIVLVLILAGPLIIQKDKGSTTAIGISFKDVGELVTQEAYVTVLKNLPNPRVLFEKITVPFTESRMIFSYDVIVKASTDFSQIEIDSIDDENKTINLKMSHSKIMEEAASIKNDSLQVYLDEDNLFSRIDLETMNKALIEIKKEAIKKATENGIVDKAEENATTLITNFVKQNKYSDYNVNIDFLEENNNE